jgi:hypothetical protein
MDEETRPDHNPPSSNLRICYCNAGRENPAKKENINANKLASVFIPVFGSQCEKESMRFMKTKSNLCHFSYDLSGYQRGEKTDNCDMRVPMRLRSAAIWLQQL